MSLQLTVDIGVLMSGSKLGDLVNSSTSFALMKNMLKAKTQSVALDSRGKIKHQYNIKLKNGTFGRSWLQLMASQGKVFIVPWKILDRGTKTQLKEAHFDNQVGEDLKYIITASGTPCKHLISHDPDYSPRVRKILKKRLKVKVHTAENAIAL
jgi:hypothetical protein